MAMTRHDDKGTGVPSRDAEQEAVLREGGRGLCASEERLHRLLEAAGLGHWDYDYVSDTLAWSEQTRKLLGVEPREPASRAHPGRCCAPACTRKTAYGSRTTPHAASTSMPITFATSSSA
jgi:hypothetical protein